MTGRWPFASGSAHSDWLMGGCLVQDGDDVRRTAGGAPDVRLALMPARQTTAIDTWSAAGLRGTGSNDFEVADEVVPEGRTVSLVSDTAREPGPLYAFPAFGLLALAIGAVGLGIARGAVDDLVALAGGKVPAMATKPLAEQPDTQMRLARAEAALRAARALVDDAVGQAWEQAVDRHDVDLERRAGLRLAASHAMTTAAGVVGRDVLAWRRQLGLRVQPAAAPPPRHPRGHPAHAGQPVHVGVRGAGAARRAGTRRAVLSRLSLLRLFSSGMFVWCWGSSTGSSSAGRAVVLGHLHAEQLGQLAVLVHLDHDVAAADQLALHEQLRDRRPARKARELLADARVGQDVQRGVANAQGVQGAGGAHREATGGLPRACPS